MTAAAPHVVSGSNRWLPPSALERLDAAGRIEYAVSFSKAEKMILRKKKKIKPSVWTEKSIIVSAGELAGAPWKNEISSQMADIMDAAAFPSVKTVIICASPQSGKSACAENFLGYCIDRAPGPAMIIYPKELDAKDNSKDRWQRMIKSSPVLRGYLTGSADDVGMLRIDLQHMPIYLAWSTSPSRLAIKSVRYLICEEVDKYADAASAKEASPIALGEARQTVYDHTKKTFKISTPTIESGAIWQALNKEAEAIFDLWVKCPLCGWDQVMVFENIKVPKDERDPNHIESERLAWYECAHCHGHWGDHLRNKARRLGKWRERVTGDVPRVGLELFAYLEARRPMKIGFHHPSWISYFVSLSKVMADWFSAVKPFEDRIKLRDFFNKHRAEPWKDYADARKEDEIVRLKDSRPENLVPSENVLGLTAGIDTQDNGFFYVIRAWGKFLESWLVRWGFIESFEALEKIILLSDYHDVNGRAYQVLFALQDAMGHKTKEVYDFTRTHAGIMAAQGVPKKAAKFTISNIDTYPGTNKPIPGGVKLCQVNTTVFKNYLARKLKINPTDPGAFHLHSATPRDYISQMTVEFVNEKGLWDCAKHKANHAWDCEYLALAAADYIGVENFADSLSQQIIEVRPVQTPQPGRRIINPWHGKR